MAENMLTDRPEYGRTFNNAMWIVGFLAVVQIVATGWAILRRPPSDAFPSVGVVTSYSPAPMQPVAPAPPANSNQDVIPYPTGQNPINSLSPERGVGSGIPDYPLATEERSVTPDVTLGNSILPQPTFIGPSDESQPLSEALANAALTAEPIADPILDRLVSTGEELRASSNMEGALQVLREAESAIPDHPRVLGGLAATLSQMGLDNKAETYWEKLYNLGPIRAGSYYQLAERQIKGEVVPAGDSTGKIMSILTVDVVEQPPGNEGQKVSLRVKIKADPAERPTGENSALLVYFFDRVNGDSVDASTADTSYLYPTEPYDWATDGSETIIVDYHQPIFTEEQQRELGERTYYGYAIELYYLDVLQDKVTMPEDITALRETLDPLVAPRTTRGVGPENALFPDPLDP